MKKQEKVKKINDFLSGKPEKQIMVGVYADYVTTRNKYVHTYSIHNNTTTSDKILIEV